MSPHPPAICQDTAQRTSTILRALVSEPGHDRITFGEILDRLSGRAFGVMLIVFAAPSCIPTPPGVSTVCGALVILIAIQLVLGRSSVWAPQMVARRSFALADLTRVVDWIAPKLERLERLSRPRAELLTGQPARQLIGVLLVMLAVIMALPIPVVGNMPPAYAIIIIGFGLVERDGLIVGIGLAVGLLSVGVIIGLGFGFTGLAAAYLPGGWWPF